MEMFLVWIEDKVQRYLSFREKRSIPVKQSVIVKSLLLICDKTFNDPGYTFTALTIL